MLPGSGYAMAVALVLFILLSAKAHGRQVRLARERLGVTAVDFRADNGPVVEAIWRHDRIRFWVAVAVVAAVFVPSAAAGFALAEWPRAGAIAIAGALAFGAGFVSAGLAAWRLQMRPQPGDPAWLERANWESFGWWTAVGAALALAVLAS